MTTTGPEGTEAVLPYVTIRILDALRQSQQDPYRAAGLVGAEPQHWASVLAGERQPDGRLLIAIATATGTPVERLLSPPSEVARRWRADAAGVAGTRDPAADGPGRDLGPVDLLVEDLARDVLLLVQAKALKPPPTDPPTVKDTPEDAERLAGWCRALVGAGDGPLHDLQGTAAALGLYVFVTDIKQGAAEDVDAVYLRVPEARCGVAWLTEHQSRASGRRRFTTAHELGHHVKGDDYRAETLGEGAGETFANLFAIFLLLPRTGVEQAFDSARRAPGGNERLAALTVSTQFGVSWSACCWHLYNLGLLDDAVRTELQSRNPTDKELQAAGLRVGAVPDRQVPQAVQEAALRAYQKRKISAAKCRHLLRDPGFALPERNQLPETVARRYARPDWLDD